MAFSERLSLAVVLWLQEEGNAMQLHIYQPLLFDDVDGIKYMAGPNDPIGSHGVRYEFQMQRFAILAMIKRTLFLNHCSLGWVLVTWQLDSVIMRVGVITRPCRRNSWRGRWSVCFTMPGQFFLRYGGQFFLGNLRSFQKSLSFCSDQIFLSNKRLSRYQAQS